MLHKIYGSVNGDDCYLDSAILQKAEELSLKSTGKPFEDLDRHTAYLLWNDYVENAMSKLGQLANKLKKVWKKEKEAQYEFTIKLEWTTLFWLSQHPS
jgi:hypothetical protein